MNDHPTLTHLIPGTPSARDLPPHGPPPPGPQPDKEQIRMSICGSQIRVPHTYDLGPR